MVLGGSKGKNINSEKLPQRGKVDKKKKESNAYWKGENGLDCILFVVLFLFCVASLIDID